VTDRGFRASVRGVISTAAQPRKIFVDGQAGTVGLRIHDLVAGRRDLTLVPIDDARRKDRDTRLACYREADAVVLCLPDDSAAEAVALAAEAGVRVLDASSAHRVADGWVYGLPELRPGQREAIAMAPRISNPGCYPTAVVLLLRPLIDAGLLPADAPITVHALSGYSGGGRAKIERWEDATLGLPHLPYEAPYALDKPHKHIPEMTRYAALAHEPLFVPAVGPFRCGMRVEVPVHARVLGGRANARALWETLDGRYRGERFIEVSPFDDNPVRHERSLDPTSLNDTNRIRLVVVPHASGHVLLVGLLDNLGKGAAGAAVQNLNLMLGLDEAAGLEEAHT
jgi:N-acetyl-gamma-glutamyl-phosphate reductase